MVLVLTSPIDGSPKSKNPPRAWRRDRLSSNQDPAGHAYQYIVGRYLGST
jgi:hypothetical protein